MKATVCVSFSVFASLAFLAVLKTRKVELDKLEARWKFDEIKLRVTNDMWMDFQEQLEKDSASLPDKQALLKTVRETITSASDMLQAVLKQERECTSQQEMLQTKVEQTERTFTAMMDKCNKEKSGWEREKAELRKQLAQTSPVCDYLKAGSEAIRNLCGDKVIPEKVEPKAEAPKPQQPEGTL